MFRVSKIIVNFLQCKILKHYCNTAAYCI